MIIDHIIVHRLEKEREKPSALHLRDLELGVSPAAEHLLQELTDVYEKKSGKAYGVFQQNRDTYPFSALLESYLNGDGQDFTSLTKQAMALFKARIDEAAWATGGYVVFILFSGDSPVAGTRERHLIVVMLNDRRGTAIEADTLEIRDIVHLVLDELHLGARIDIPAWRSGSSEKYLSFIKGPKSGVSVSRYFREFVGCAEYVDSVRDSRMVVKALDRYVKQRNLPKTRARQIRKIVIEDAEEKQEKGELVDLAELSPRIDPEEPQGFLQFTGAEKISSTFEPHLQTLRPLGRFHYSDDDLTVSFDTRLLGNVVQFDAERDSLTIHPLPAGLRKKLEKAV